MTIEEKRKKLQMRKVLVTGANGLLGQNLLKILSGKYYLCTTGIEEESFSGIKPDLYVKADISNKKSVIELIKKTEPEIIINCAALTNVDLCEKEPLLAEMVNIAGTANLLESCECKFIQISTDYVFNGENGPYSEESKVDPISIYGITKLQAELATLETSIDNLVVRTCVVYGNGINLNTSFVEWVKQSLESGKEIKIVNDQISNMTLASNLAENIAVLLEENKNGIWHIAGSEIIGRDVMAKIIAEEYGLDSGLIKTISTSELNQAAPRPLNGGLKVEKAAKNKNIKLLNFKEQLILYRKEQNG